MRLRKIRWNIYQKIRLGDKDVKGVLGYYRSLIKRFLKRFSAKLKPREPGIWKEKLSKTVRDVTKFLREKRTPNSTCETNTLKSKSSNKAGATFDRSCNPEKNKNVPMKKTLNAECVTTDPQQKGTYYTIMAEYMSKMDSALFMVLHLVRNEKTKFEDRPFEAPLVETLDNDLKEVIEATNEPEVTEVAVDEALVKTLDDVTEIAETRTKETAAPVESINKDSEEYHTSR